MTDSNCPKLRKSHGSLRSKPEKKLGDEDQSLVKGAEESISSDTQRNIRSRAIGRVLPRMGGSQFDRLQ
jgi:hypothetical protein